MQLGGNNQQRLPTVPGRPVTPFAAGPSQTGPPTMPISSAIPQSSAAPQTSMAYSSGFLAAFQAPVPRGPPPVGYNGPSSSPPIYASKGSIGSSQFPPPSQTGPTLHGRVSQEQPPPMSQVSFLPPGSQFPSSRPVPGYQRPSVPLGIQSSSTIGSNMPPPPLSGKMQPPPIGGPPSVGGIVTPPPIGGTFTPPPSIAGNTAQGYLSMPTPSLASSYQAGRPVLQQPFAGANIQGPPLQPSLFHGHQGVTPGPPVPPVGFTSKDNIPYHLGGPPLGGSLQGLVEEFQSLSVGSAPGSLDAGIDVRSLPRPLNDASDSNPISEQYPFNCHPRYFQLSTHAIPNSQSLLSRWHLPLGAVVHPLAEAPDGEDVPIVNFGPAGIIRCRRCRTYINPYVTFTDGGRKWRCNLCSLLNDVPGEYFCNLDATGRRLDVNQRPELAKGSVEYVAPTEYMVRPPMPPIYFFLIDVSMAAVQCGMLEVVAKTIKSCLDELPGFPRTQIGFITYDSTLHFYNMKSSLAQPQMMVVADLDDVFLPLPDDLLVNLSDSRNVVDAFLDSLPSMFLGNMNVESALGPALKAAFMVMSQLGGKLMVFQTTLPSLGIGRLKLRGDDLRIYGTDKEHTSRIPEDPSYKQLAAEFSKFHLGVNVYAFSDKYIDIASLGSLAKYTGGQVYYYPSFQAGVHNEKLKHDLSRDLTRETAWEAVMRVRCGKGARFTAYHGHFMLRSSDLLALPAVDCDKAFAMQLSLEETLLTSPTVYFQVALLYTSSSGERRIRVHTAAAPVVTDLSELYRQADIGAVVTLLNRVAIEKSLSHKLEEARQFVQMKIMKSLKEYRNLYVVQHRLGGRLIYPESLKLLPLYGLALCKSLALRGGYADALLDDRCAAGFNMMISSSNKTLKLLYPSLFKIDEYILKGTSESDNFGDALKALPLTGAVLDSKSLYVLDDGSRFVVWFGRMLSPDILTDIVGLESSSLPDLSKVPLVQRETTASKKLVKFLGKLKENDRSCYQLCHFVRQGEQPRENVLFLSNLVEDQTAGTSGYVEWISQLYRQTQQNP